jgi:hypothetical protein
MPDNTNIVEPHGCIVCGKIYNLLVVHSPSGRMVACSVVSHGGQLVPDETRPLVACSQHSAKEIETAVERHYPGRDQPEDSED